MRRERAAALALSAAAVLAFLAGCGDDEDDDPPARQAPVEAEAPEVPSVPEVTEVPDASEVPEAEVPDAVSGTEASELPEPDDPHEPPTGPVDPSEVDPGAPPIELRELFDSQVAGILAEEGLSKRQIECSIEKLDEVPDATIRDAAQAFQETGTPPPDVVAMVSEAIEPCL